MRKYLVRPAKLYDGRWVLEKVSRWLSNEVVGYGDTVQQCVQLISKLENPLYYDATGRRVR